MRRQARVHAGGGRGGAGAGGHRLRVGVDGARRQPGDGRARSRSDDRPRRRAGAPRDADVARVPHHRGRGRIGRARSPTRPRTSAPSRQAQAARDSASRRPMRCGATRPGYVDYLDATGRDLGRRAGAREQAGLRATLGDRPSGRRRRRGRRDRGAGGAGVDGRSRGGRRSDAPDRLARRRRAARRAGAPGVMRGASLIELLIAVALALVISAAGVRALVEAVDAFAWQPASARAVGPGRRGGAAPHRRSGGCGRRAVRPPRVGRAGRSSRRRRSGCRRGCRRSCRASWPWTAPTATTSRPRIACRSSPWPTARRRRRCAGCRRAGHSGRGRRARRSSMAAASATACRCCGSRHGPDSSWAKPTPWTPRAWTCPA